MPEEIITAPVVEGLPEGTGSQEAQPGSQEPVQSQETTHPQGREDGQQPSSQGEARKPSQFYRERQLYKTKMENLERSNAELREIVSKMQNPAASPPARPALKLDKDAFWQDPAKPLDEILTEREKLWKEDIKREILETDLPKHLSEADARRKDESNRQEALELIFPKSGQDDKRTLKERSEANPERTAKIHQFVVDNHLDLIWEKDPQKAASLVAMALGENRAQTPKNPNAIKKSLTGSTATGSPISAGGKQMATLAEIKAQYEALDVQVDKNPDLRYDPSWKGKRAELKNQLIALAKEQMKNQ